MFATDSHRGSLLLIPLLALAACGAPEGDDALPEEAEDAMEMAEEAVEEAGEMAEGAVEAAEGAVEAAEEAMDMPGAVTLELETLNESGVTGTVTATRENESLVVEIGIEGAPDAEELQAHIHEGECATGGGVLVPLEPVAVADGTGSSSTTIAMDQLPVEGMAYVQVHGPDGQPIACADMEGQEPEMM